MKLWLGPLVVALAVGALSHVSLLGLVPQVVMDRYLSTTASRAGGVNVMVFGARSVHEARRTVRPSPDLLYSTCVYDLSNGPVRVVSPVPNDTYWSLALYASNTDNFFVLNDAQTRGRDRVDLLINLDKARLEGARLPVIKSPSVRGVVLIRTLINDEARLAELDAQRRQSVCSNYTLPRQQTPLAPETAVMLPK